MAGDRKRESARRRAAAQRAVEAATQEAAQRRRRLLVGGAVAAVVLAVVVAIVVQTQRSSTSADAAVPAGTVADGTAFPVGQDGAPVTVDVYEDFQCPVCGQFEQINGATLEELAAGGDALVRYRPIAILDRASTTDYSTRSLNAAAVVFDEAGAEAFSRFHDLLFAQQPAEGGAGLSDDELVDLAGQAGATGQAVEDGIRDLVYEDWTAQVTEAASRAGITGTPTLLVDGERVQGAELTPDGIRAAVSAAAEG